MELDRTWAFGMAPPSPETVADRIWAAEQVLDLVENGSFVASTAEAMSEVKGLFNRIWRQDQWDWFTVYSLLGYPSNDLCQSIASAIAECRTAIVRERDITAELHRLRSLPLQACLKYYLGRRVVVPRPGAGWIYLLSTRNAPTSLLIGRAEHSVEQRVREINDSTDASEPYGIRGCWRVTDPAAAEERIHGALAEWRVQAGEDLFRLPDGRAVRIINDALAAGRLELRTLDMLSGLSGSVSVFQT